MLLSGTAVSAQVADSVSVDSVSVDLEASGVAARDSLTAGIRTARTDSILTDLALTLDISVDSLLAARPELLSFIESGDLEPAAPATPATTITVARGETLFALARRHSVTVAAIQQANNMSGTALQVGQRLRIPGSASGAAADESATGIRIVASGVATVYPDTYSGRMMASGRRYDPETLVISHPDLTLGSVVLIHVPDTGLQSFAVVADRGFQSEPLLIDISETLAQRLGLIGSEDRNIEIRASGADASGGDL